MRLSPDWGKMTRWRMTNCGPRPTFRETFVASGYGPAPLRHLVVVACMDARLDLFRMLGLEVGDAHLLRNAGGLVTDDVIRSLTLSQRALGTRQIVLVHHTDCGLQKIDDEGFLAELEAETGHRPPWRPGRSPTRSRTSGSRSAASTSARGC